MPVTMETFYKHVKASSERCARRLEEEWLQECCELIDNLRDSIEEWMPQDDQVSRLKYNVCKEEKVRCTKRYCK